MLLLIAITNGYQVTNEVVLGFVYRSLHHCTAFHGKLTLVLKYFHWPYFHRVILWARGKYFLLLWEEVQFPINHSYWFLVSFFYHPKDFKLALSPFPQFDRWIWRACKKIRRLSNGFVQVIKVTFQPFIFLNLVQIHIPRQVVNNLHMCLYTINNFQITIEYFHRTIWKTHSQ